MSRVITYLPVPDVHRHVQELLMEALKDKYYKQQTLRNIGLTLIKFFEDLVKCNKESYHVKMRTQGDTGEIEVFYQEKGQDKIILMIIKQENEK